MKSVSCLKWKRPCTVAVLGAVCLSFLTTGCSFFGIRNTEEAGYAVIDKHDPIEIREYDELVVVETFVNTGYEEAGTIAFKKLFAYISGENILRTKIAMTSPVISKEGDVPAGDKIAMTSPVLGQRQDKGWRYSFVLPAGYTLENAPLPSNPEVKLAVVPKKKVAVIRYAGSWKEQTIREKSKELVEWIQANGLERLSGPRSARYDPPWTIPFLRRNEVMIDVD